MVLGTPIEQRALREMKKEASRRGAATTEVVVIIGFCPKWDQTLMNSKAATSRVVLAATKALGITGQVVFFDAAPVCQRVSLAFRSQKTGRTEYHCRAGIMEDPNLGPIAKVSCHCETAD
jgi:hypothetical protein